MISVIASEPIIIMIDDLDGKRRLIEDQEKVNGFSIGAYTDSGSRYFTVDLDKKDPEEQSYTRDDYIPGSTERVRGYCVIIDFPAYEDSGLFGFTETNRNYIAIRSDLRGGRRKMVEDHEMAHQMHPEYSESHIRGLTGTRMESPSDDFYVQRRVA